ncbi:MAG: FAD-dependent oxidoreductase [Roseitalea porphyridii]|jgi:3-phenylpropionate/trans-cinnamate dioxygenase ferredoxin reductase subunit
MPEPIIIVGAGQAGVKAAETLRAKRCSDPIVMIGDEPWLPYQRPPLSKAFLQGKTDDERLFLKSADWFDTADVALMAGVRATGFDTTQRTLALDDGRTLAYSKLLLATGTRARTLPLPGSNLDGVVTLRGLDDSKRIRDRLRRARRVVIVGGGFVGMEVAAAVRAMDGAPGRHVTVVEAQSRILKRAVAPALSDYLHRLHTSNGVEILTDTGVARFAGDGRVDRVELADGTGLSADLVLLSAGAQPEIDLAASAGLKIDRGIVVDTACRTSASRVFAAGDCTVFDSRRYGKRIGLESVQNACDQAKHAAGAMLGEPVEYDPVPWFWSDQYDVKLQIAGLSEGFDRLETVGEPETGRFTVRYFAGSALLAADSINDARGHMMARRDIAVQPAAIAA